MNTFTAVFALAAVAVVPLSAEIEVKCSENSVFEGCRIAPCPPSCSIPVKNFSLPCTIYCESQCQCGEGLVRSHEGGPCVLPQDCKECCKEGEVFMENKEFCPEDCYGHVKGCYGLGTGRFCKEGYVWKNMYDRRCIPKSQCVYAWRPTPKK